MSGVWELTSIERSIDLRRDVSYAGAALVRANRFLDRALTLVLAPRVIDLPGEIEYQADLRRLRRLLVFVRDDLGMTWGDYWAMREGITGLDLTPYLTDETSDLPDLTTGETWSSD